MNDTKNKNKILTLFLNTLVAIVLSVVVFVTFKILG